jgi:hypothetical protein
MARVHPCTLSQKALCGRSGCYSAPVMFGKRQTATDPAVLAELSALREELARLQRAFRSLEEEQAAMHDRVHRHMKRTLAAERAGRNQEPDGIAAPAAVTPDPRQAAGWLDALSRRGARGRIAARRLAAALRGRGDDDVNGHAEPEGADDGVHP